MLRPYILRPVSKHQLKILKVFRWTSTTTELSTVWKWKYWTSRCMYVGFMAWLASSCSLIISAQWWLLITIQTESKHINERNPIIFSFKRPKEQASLIRLDVESFLVFSWQWRIQERSPDNASSTVCRQASGLYYSTGRFSRWSSAMILRTQFDLAASSISAFDRFAKIFFCLSCRIIDFPICSFKAGTKHWAYQQTRYAPFKSFEIIAHLRNIE